ncbi:MAG: glycosyltransferase [Oscillospiraceae bacterium]|nr:glycosyltransferase [Oscillospiraceae bacterium]
MKKMNVCLVNDSFPPLIDGVANAVVNYAEVINRELGSASVVTPFYPNADDAAYPFPVIRYPSLDFTKFVGYRAGMPFSPETAEQIEKSGFDVIHSHCPVTSTMLARTMRESIHAPIIITYHTKFDVDIANAIRGRYLQQKATELLVRNISACDEVWTVSRGAGENLRSLGYEGDYIVMPNGVDFTRGRVSEKQEAKVTCGLDLPKEVPVFLFVGRMMWYKGIRIILDALKILKNKEKQFRMVFIGGGGDRDEIIAYAEQLQLTDCTFFIPPIHDRDTIRAWYCRADLFLFPSTFDTNGLVVREAAACGLASMLIRGSCAAEDSTDSVDGILIEENAEAMAQALLQVMDHRELMSWMGKNASESLYMSWEDSVKNAYERYGTVVENYRSGRCPSHEKLTDEMFARTGQALELLNRNRNRRQAAIERIQEEYRDIRTEIETDRELLLNEWKDGRSRIREDLEEVRSELRAREKHLSEELEEIIDRFL